MDIRSSLGKLGAVAAVITLAAAFGCDDPTPDGVAAPGVEEVAADADEERKPVPPVHDPAVGDVVPVGHDGGSVAVLAVEADVNAGRLFSPGKGREYYAAEVRACSGPNEKGLTFQKQYFLLEMPDKTVHDPGLGVKRPELIGGEVPAGGCLDGWVTFTIPEGRKPAFVVYDGSSQMKWRVPAEEPASS